MRDNEKCIGCGNVYQFEERWNMTPPPDYCRCGGALRPANECNYKMSRPPHREHGRVNQVRSRGRDLGLPSGMWRRTEYRRPDTD